MDRRARTSHGKSRTSHGKYCGNEVEYVLQALDSEDGRNKTNPWTQRLEAEVCRRFGVRYAIAHNSGTSALHSCLAAAGVGPGDEVISPALAVVMDSYVALHLGAVPVFADVEPDTQNIDPDDVRRKITPRTKVIITVSLQGLPANVAPIMQMAKERDIVVVEDCAQTMLGRYDCTTRCPGCEVACKGKYSGTVGHVSILSFESKKHVSTGEGGMVLTNDERLAERARKFGGIGYKNLKADAGRMSILPSEFQDPMYERFDTLGLNYRMPELCAAVGLAQFERVQELVARRQEIATIYRKAIEGCFWMTPQTVPDGYEHTYYTYAVQYRGEEEFGLPWKAFWQRYKDFGGDGFYGACRPPYLEPVYANIRIAGHTFGPGLCPVAEQIQPRIMQFKTNYRSLDVARQKIEILAKLIDSLGR
jgi:perosamine synthetase